MMREVDQAAQIIPDVLTVYGCRVPLAQRYAAPNAYVVDDQNGLSGGTPDKKALMLVSSEFVG